MTSRARLIAPPLLALAVWTAGAPLLAVSCVPGVPCRMSAACSAAKVAAPAQDAVSAQECCQRSERRTTPAKVERLSPDRLVALGPALAVAVAMPPQPGRVLRQGLASERASPVPLHTLHSILLI
jgi:hypothetical protein